MHNMSRRKKHHKRVIKKTGETELFIPQKLCNSMEAVGAPPHIANQVCIMVDENINSGVSTDKIFITTRQYLKEFNPKIAALYSLERGLGALGPSGFIFEQYVAALFRETDYKVETNVYLEGEGVSHEIDVLAHKGRISYIIEAKYRNEYKTKTHIKQVMYADARLGDIRRKAKKDGKDREYYMWMVTNTRFTKASINYVAYRDLQLMGWDFPNYINLKKIVSSKKLYPVTVLPSITQKALKGFASDGIILVKSLCTMSSENLQKRYNLSVILSNKLIQEIHELM